MNRRLLPAALLAAAPSLLFAQDPHPAEVAAESAREAAKVATESALADLEAYGRDAPQPAPTPKELRRRALDRLTSYTPPRRVRARLPKPFYPEERAEELEAFREAILDRLRTLDPERFAEPDEEPWRKPAPLVFKMLDVQDLVYTPSDHVAPPVGLTVTQSGGGGGGASGVISFHDADETTGVGISPDTLIELIETELGEDSERGSVEYSGGRLILRKTAAEVARVRALLARLSQERGGLVDLEVRIYRMPPEVFTRLRGRATALDDAGEAALAQAVTDGQAELLSSHRVIAHDGQRVHVRRGGSRSLVSDIEVNQTGVVPVLCPVVNVVNEGLVVEMRPIVDRKRGLVLLDAALSLSTLGSDVEGRTIQGIALELPSMEIARSGTSACVPLGRGALLGGVFRMDAPGKSPTSVVYVRPKLVRAR
jgi:hypothetical protein